MITLGKEIKRLSKRKDKPAEEKEREEEKIDKIPNETTSIYLFNNLEKLELTKDGKLAAKILIEKIKLIEKQKSIRVKDFAKRYELS